MCCPCAIQRTPFGLPYGLFFTTQGPESRRTQESRKLDFRGAWTLGAPQPPAWNLGVFWERTCAETAQI